MAITFFIILNSKPKTLKCLKRKKIIQHFHPSYSFIALSLSLTDYTAQILNEAIC